MSQKMSAAEKNSSPFVLRIGNFGAHQHPTRIRIDHRADGGNPSFKHMVRKGRHVDIDLLVKMQGRAVAFGRFSLQQVGAVDRQQRLALLHIATGTGKQADDSTLIRGKQSCLH
jgi:hypothetical protein